VSQHFAASEVTEILEGGGSPERRRELAAHLVRGCPPCRAAVASVHSPRPEACLTPEVDAAYDAVFERAIDFARRAQSLPREELPCFHQALLRLRYGGLPALAQSADLPAASRGLCEALLARSWAVRYDDPAEMCRLAEAAVEVAERLRPWFADERELADLQARAWGELANALRVADQLRRAEKAFGEAFAFLIAGTGDRLLKARLFDLEASLLGTLRELNIACGRLTLVSTLYQEIGEYHLAGRALITKALYTFYNGKVEEAIEVNGEGLALIDGAEEPGLVLLAVHNQLLFLTDCDRFEQAAAFLAANRPRLQETGRVAALKLRGIEGRISYGLGDLMGAEAAFREVKQGFADAGLGFACALITLELALTLLRQGRAAEAEGEVRAAITIFSSLKIQRELIGSIRLLDEALRLRRVTVDLLDVTLRQIRRRSVEPLNNF